MEVTAFPHKSVVFQVVLVFVVFFAVGLLEPACPCLVFTWTSCVLSHVGLLV